MAQLNIHTRYTINLLLFSAIKRSFSERDLTFMFAICYRPSICLSVMSVHPTQSVEIFSDVSAPYGTWPSVDIHKKFFTEIVPGEPIRRWERKMQDRWPNIAILDLSKAISRKRCKIGDKLVLITKRKSYMSFQLVPKLVTFNDPERRNGPYVVLFH